MDSDIYIIQSMKVATKLMKESSGNIRTTIDLVKCALDNVTRTKRNIKLTTSNVKDILLDSKSCSQDVKELLSEAGIRGVIGETSRGIVEVTKVVTENTHTINTVMLSVQHITHVINMATKRVTRAMNKIIRASAGHDVSSVALESTVRKTQARTEFIKTVTDQIVDNAKRAGINTETSRRNTDRMRKITDYIQWNVKRVRNSDDDLEDVIDSISDIAKLYCHNLSAVNDLVSATNKRYSYSDILDKDVKEVIDVDKDDLMENQTVCNSCMNPSTENFVEDTTAAGEKRHCTEGMDARDNIKDASETVDSTAKTVDDISEAMKGMIIYNYIAESLNEQKLPKDVSDTSESTFRDIMDMINHTTESIASLSESINECTDASNSILNSISSTANTLDDIMMIMGDDGEGKELFTVYIPKESESGYESTGTMTGDLMKVLTDSENGTMDSDLTLTDVEVDDVLKKDGARIGMKRYSRVKRNWSEDTLMNQATKEWLSQGNTVPHHEKDCMMVVKDTTVTLNFREILTDVLESVESVLDQVEKTADCKERRSSNNVTNDLQSAKPSSRKTKSPSPRKGKSSADSTLEKGSHSARRKVDATHTKVDASPSQNDAAKPVKSASTKPEHAQQSRDAHAQLRPKDNAVRDHADDIPSPFRSGEASHTYERISKSDRSLPEKSSFVRERKSGGKDCHRPKSSESSLDRRSVSFRNRQTGNVRVLRHRHTMPPRTRNPKYLGDVFGAYPEWNYFSEDSFVSTSVDEEESPSASTWTYVETDGEVDSCYLHDLRPSTHDVPINDRHTKKKKDKVLNRCSIM